ncbi:contactin-associated protein like 5-1-like [Nematostella vectensis]|uniref:contactin-associated protein like 5-1-like n=1 Tax=Nematostella vectensis TaxID=45351 RepID=UPI002077328F|nr:contactin-associated protein like 5-1-like [Nematostella vectensis]
MPEFHFNEICFVPGASSTFLQVDLGSEMFIIKVSTQGFPFSDYWVTKYKIKALKGGSWSWYRNSSDEIRYFDGNYDSDTVVSHRLLPSVQTRYIRIYPVKGSNHLVGLRVDFFGCPIGKTHLTVLGLYTYSKKRCHCKRQMAIDKWQFYDRKDPWIPKYLLQIQKNINKTYDCPFNVIINVIIFPSQNCHFAIAIRCSH